MAIRPGRGVVLPPPERRAALPLVVLVPPPLVLLVRELALCRTPIGCSRVAVGGYAALVLVAAVVAVFAARAAGAGRVPDWLAPRPDDPTLVALGAIVSSLTVYVGAAALGLVPVWLGRLLAPVGALLALPLAVVHAALVGSARSLGPLPASVSLGVTAVGIALTGAWWYALAKTVAHGLGSVNEPRD